MADVTGPPPARKPRAPRRPAAKRPPVPAETPEQAVVITAAEAVAPEATPAASGRGAYEAIWRTGLLTLGTVARRELGAYFVSPIGYLVGAPVVAIVAIFGYLLYLVYQLPVSVAQVYRPFVVLMLVVGPLLTMRLLAEERRSGTLEVLLTSPVRDWEVVTGKWLAALAFFTLATLSTLVVAALIIHYQPTLTIVRVLGRDFEVGNIDFGPAVTGYLGLLLAGGAFLAIGLCASSLTSNQIIAAVLGIAALIGLYFILGYVGGLIPGAAGEFLNYLSALNRLNSFFEGRLVLRDVIYFLSLIAGGLFLATRILESRRWR